MGLSSVVRRERCAERRRRARPETTSQRSPPVLRAPRLLAPSPRALLTSSSILNSPELRPISSASSRSLVSTHPAACPSAARASRAPFGVLRPAPASRCSTGRAETQLPSPKAPALRRATHLPHHRLSPPFSSHPASSPTRRLSCACDPIRNDSPVARGGLSLTRVVERPPASHPPPIRHPVSPPSAFLRLVSSIPSVSAEMASATSFLNHLGGRPPRYRTPSPPRRAIEPISPSSTTDFRIMWNERSAFRPTSSERDQYTFSDGGYGARDDDGRQQQPAPDGGAHHRAGGHGRSGSTIDTLATIALATSPTFAPLSYPSAQNAAPANPPPPSDARESVERPAKRARSEKGPSPALEQHDAKPASCYDSVPDSMKTDAELLLNFARPSNFRPKIGRAHV